LYIRHNDYIFPVLRNVLEKGAELETKDEDGRTPLSYAASKRHEAVVGLLLEKGADVEVKSNNGRTSLSCATENGNPELNGIVSFFGIGLSASNCHVWVSGMSYQLYEVQGRIDVLSRSML
jgi:hypothetical protein